MQQAEIIAVLLMLMAALIVIAKKLEVPHPVVLGIGGLAVSGFGRSAFIRSMTARLLA